MGTTFEQPNTCPQRQARAQTCCLRLPCNVRACPETFSVGNCLSDQEKSDLSPEMACIYYYH